MAFVFSDYVNSVIWRRDLRRGLQRYDESDVDNKCITALTAGLVKLEMVYAAIGSVEGDVER